MSTFERKSETKAWAAGAPIVFPNWVEDRGPTGRRTVIEKFTLHFVDTDVDVATAAIQGEDAARFFARVAVEQIDGRVRWNLRGDATRIMSFLLDGADRYPESADVAVGCANDLDLSLPVPMAKRFAKKGSDFSLPAEALKEVRLQAPDQSELDLGSSAVTIQSGSYYVIAHCREEDKISLKAEDEVREHAFATTAETTISIGGFLHEIALYARGASGGASLSNLTDATVLEFYNATMRRVPDLENRYRQYRDVSSALGSTVGSEVFSDPFVNDAACALWCLPKGARILDAPHIPSNITLRLTNTVSSLIALTRTVVPKSQRIAQAVMRKYGLTEQSFRVNTEGKTRRSPKAWGKWGAYMPLSAPLPRAG